MGQATLFSSGDFAAAEGAGSRFVRVAVERGIDRFGSVRAGQGRGGESTWRDDAGLTYRDPGLSLGVGERVIVPLGKGDVSAQGIVVQAGGAELLGELAPGRVKGVLSRGSGRLPASLVELASWIAGYYVCPLGMAFATMVPAAVKKGVGTRSLTLLARAESPETEAIESLPGKVREVWSRVGGLEAGEFPASAKQIAGVLGLKTVRAINQLLGAGLLVKVEVERTRARREIADFSSVEAQGPRPTLNAEQSRTAEAIMGSLGQFGVHLIRGVTGSGKTEVYMHVLERVLSMGKRGVVLVPEIALTPQTSARFTARFGSGRVAVLHSGLTAAQRHEQWKRAEEGAVDAVVGARSAIFAPLANLGLIVVDEEHDSSYKQDQLPRYHGRDVAIKRGQIEGCPVVLGSATPALESWANAKGGRSTLHELTTRATNAPLPPVRVVDMMLERRERARQGDYSQRLIGPTLEAALDRTLVSGGQAILLLNRRGFASHICCRNAACGFVLSCDQCSASLVHHKDRSLPLGSLVRCHHCLGEQLLPTLCPACGGKLHAFGGGTQRAIEEVERMFASRGLEAGSTLVRVDSDSMRSASDYFGVLSRFARGEARVLLGTQMIAKGLDFPNVRLVGVIDADTASAIPDFRASERTFQLVSQVAGRAGRGETPGLVIVQTLEPGSEAIRHAARHDYAGFADAELAARRRFGLPPATRMARVVCRDEKAEKAIASAERIVNALGSLGAAIRVRGPVECAIARISNQYRFAVEIVAGNAGELQRALQSARSRGVFVSDSKTAVDVDPVAMM